MTSPCLFADLEALGFLCRRRHIRRLALFGSILKDCDHPDSDVDLLVEFEEGRKPGLLALSGIEAELSELLGGRRVDLRTREDLSRYFREEVERTAEITWRCDSILN